MQCRMASFSSILLPTPISSEDKGHEQMWHLESRVWVLFKIFH